MARYVMLDTGPTWLAVKPPGHPDGDQCRAWIDALRLAGAQVALSAIVDYEARRELLRKRASAAVRRLDDLGRSLLWIPVTDTTLREAATLWAIARQTGRPTSDPAALDADVILAAQATLLAGPGDTVIVATTNPSHLTQFVTARDWRTVT